MSVIRRAGAKRPGNGIRRAGAKRPGNGTGRRSALLGYGLLAPSLFGVVCFLLLPMLVVVWLSLHRWDLLGPIRFVGLDNWRSVLTDPSFGNSLLAAALSIVLAVLATGRTTLVVAHRLATIRRADRIVVMTYRPGKIKKQISVSMSRQRDPSSVEFNELKKELSLLVMEEQLRHNQEQIKMSTAD